VAKRTVGMTLIAALSLFVGISGVLGSAAVVSDGLGLSRFSTVAGAPSVGTTSAPPSEHAVNAAVVAFGVVRALLSLLLIAGGIGTLWVRPSARRYSLVFAAGWIVLGVVEPLALHYMFGWPVVVSALYPFLLLFAFNSPSWRAAFAGAPASAGEATPPAPGA
jgi:hypothetical protein